MAPSSCLFFLKLFVTCEVSDLYFSPACNQQKTNKHVVVVGKLNFLLTFEFIHTVGNSRDPSEGGCQDDFPFVPKYICGNKINQIINHNMPRNFRFGIYPPPGFQWQIKFLLWISYLKTCKNLSVDWHPRVLGGMTPFPGQDIDDWHTPHPPPWISRDSGDQTSGIHI